MPESSRREAILLAMGSVAAAALPGHAAAKPRGQRAAISELEASCASWRRGPEGRRLADLGNGTYRNPVLAGDHSDPSVIKHEGRYFIYFPVANLDGLEELKQGKTPKRPIMAIHAVHADSMAGPWSDPVDLMIYDGIDPGHIIGEDGKRYLFISDGRLVPISDNGLARAGATEKVYDGWQYPEDWVVETFALESPTVESGSSGWLDYPTRQEYLARSTLAALHLFAPPQQEVIHREVSNPERAGRMHPPSPLDRVKCRAPPECRGRSPLPRSS